MATETEVLQGQVKDLQEQIKQLQEFMGLPYLTGDAIVQQYGTRQLSQLSDDDFIAVKKASKELPNGENNFGIFQADILGNTADQRKDLDRIAEAVDAFKPPDTQTIIDAAAAKVLASLGSTTVSPGALVAEDTIGGGHRAELGLGRVLLKANTQRNKVQGGIDDEFQVELDCNGWDSGSKIKRNFNCVGTRKRPSSSTGPNGYGSWEHSTWPAVDPYEDASNDRAGWKVPGHYQDYGPIFDRNGVKVEKFYRGHGIVALQGEQQLSDANGNKIAQRRQLGVGPQRQGWSYLRFVCPERPGQQDDNGTGGTPENLVAGGEDGSPGVRDRSLIFVENQLHRIKMRGDGSLYAELIPAGYFNP